MYSNPDDAGRDDVNILWGRSNNSIPRGSNQFKVSFPMGLIWIVTAIAWICRYLSGCDADPSEDASVEDAGPKL